jgi:hypothetical protein
MTINAGPDPVNRWATEHYGFEDDAAEQDTPTTTTGPAGTSPTPEVPPRRRRSALVAAGVLAASLVAGFGGVAVAADAPGNGSVDDRGAGRGVIVRFDRGGDLGGDARGFGRR